MRRRLGPTLLAISLLTAVAGIAVAAVSRFVFPFRPRLVHIVVRLPRRHAGLHGTTIGFVTDTHIGPHFAATDLAPVASMLRNARPDIVLFGGDYVSESPRFLKDAAVAVGEIAATGRYGSWGIVGNHDLSNIRPRIEAALAGAGITLLTNSAACVDLPGGELWIAGIDDAILGRPDLEAAFRGIPSDAPSIALWHEPDRAERTAPFGPFLQLSGHSHGGQVRLPFLGEIAAPVLGRRFVRGRYEIGDMTLYVSSGVGMYRPPVRLNCPPEVTLVHLVA
jgi:predicted MPP superfamily phosphohydrolase